MPTGLTLTHCGCQTPKQKQVYGWVAWFESRVTAAREQELSYLLKRAAAKAWLRLLGAATPILVTGVVFASWLLMYGEACAPQLRANTLLTLSS